MTPPPGLAYDGGSAITGLNVEITFAEPLISTSNGFGFQLNGYARKQLRPFVLEHYCIPHCLPSYRAHLIAYITECFRSEEY